MQGQQCPPPPAGTSHPLPRSTRQPGESCMGPEKGNGVPSPVPPLEHCQEQQDKLPRQDTTPQALQRGGGVLSASEGHRWPGPPMGAHTRGCAQLPSSTMHHRLLPLAHCRLGGPDKARGCQMLPPVPSTLAPAFVPAARLRAGTQGACVAHGVQRWAWDGGAGHSEHLALCSSFAMTHPGSPHST